MTDLLTFRDTEIPADALPRDEAPPSAFEYACQTCGKELHYGGRGRKPKFCDEHKKGGSSNTVSRKGGNVQLATQAADALVQLNSLCAMGLMLAHLPETAGALASTEEGFRQQAINSLITDPALCKTILKAGTTSGKVSLLIAYAMLASAVVPVAVVEVKEAQALKAADDANRTEV